jgi:phosphoglycerate kinase
LGQALDTAAGLKAAQVDIAKADHGTVFLLENVRYYAGEEKNDPKLGKAYAALADLFVNDAFASCHRAHASVVGVAKYLPAYAGPTLRQEVEAMAKLITKPKRPYVAVVGGAKLSTKIPVLKALLETADTVMLGGAMATVFALAQGREIGQSFVEKGAVSTAKKLLRHPRLLLPVDVVVAPKIAPGFRAHAVSVIGVGKKDHIGDIGPATMQAWAEVLKGAKTIVWNGPVGVTEIPTFAHGSKVIARVIASRAKGKAFGVAGGGDTLPVVLASGMAEWYDHLSTGGGAMLEFLAEGGKLPGLTALIKKSAKRT